MWVIAGLIIGTIVFGGSYMLFSHWIENNELKETKVNFELLTQSIVKTCNQGTDKLEISRFVFPPIVKNITIKNKETNEEGIGFLLCIQFENEELCKEIDSEKYGCDLPVIMQSINMGEKKGLFYVIQKAMKKSKAKNVDFEISKTVEDNICVHWDIKDEDSDIGVKPDLLNEGEQCTSTCYCGDKLLCDEFGYCCPEKHYFDGSQCVPYRGDGTCQIYIEENCEEEPNDCACSNNQCCYGCKNSDEQGCCPVDTVVCDNTCIEKPTQPKQPEDKCKCDAECGSNLKCEDRHCICEDGFTWNKETKKYEEPQKDCEETELNIVYMGNSNSDSGRGGKKLDTIILHFTNGHKPDVTHSYMLGAGNSVHYILGRKCDIIQDVKEKDTAWHAGVYLVNQKSVGIEIENLGELCEQAKGAYVDQPYGACISKNGYTWEKYIDKQMDCLLDLVYDIANRNKIPMDRNHIKGHSEVSSAKMDPGPLFDWNRLMKGLKEKEENCK